MRKLKLRKQALAARLSSTESQVLSKTITGHLTGCSDWRDACVILAYRPLSGEVETRLIAEYAVAQGKTVYYPRVAGDRIVFHSPPKGGVYKRGGLGVEEPDPEWPIWDIADTAPTLVLVPALGFDGRGYRLGRGAGYYDRFTAQVRGQTRLSVRVGGLCFAQNLLVEFPEDPWDEPMDWVLTETGFVSV